MLPDPLLFARDGYWGPRLRSLHRFRVGFGLLLIALAVGLALARWPRVRLIGNHSGLAPLVALWSVYLLGQARRRRRDPLREDVFRSIARWGADPLAVAREVEADVAAGLSVGVLEGVITPRWFVGGSDAIPLARLVAVQPVETVHTFSGIEVATTQKLRLFTDTGRFAERPYTTSFQATEIELALRRWAPWAFRAQSSQPSALSK